MTPQPPSVRDRAAGPAEERLQLLIDACHGLQNDRLRAFIDQGGIGKVLEKMAQPVGPLVPASRDETVERLTSELQAVNNHLDFAYQAIGLSKYSSEPLSEAIRRLRERAEAVVKCKRETVSPIPHRLLHWINFLEAALSPPPSTPEERSVENG